jgi:predicted MFS family arabinose efflux permease
MSERHSFLRKVTLAIAAIIGFSLLLNAFLSYSTFRRSLSEIRSSRFAVMADDIRHTAEYGLNLGLAFSALNNIERVLARAQTGQPDVRRISLFGPDGIIRFDTDSTQAGRTAPLAWRDKTSRLGPAVRAQLQGKDTLTLLYPLHNSFNIPAGFLAFSYSTAAESKATHALLVYLLKWCGLLMVVAAGLGFALLSLFTRRSGWHGFIEKRIMLMAILLLVLTAALCTGLAIRYCQREIGPELQGKAVTLAESMAALIDRAVAYGIPPDSLRGLDELCASVYAGNPEIEHIVLHSVPGKILYGNTRNGRLLDQLPAGAGLLDATATIIQNGCAVAVVRVGTGPQYVQAKTKGVLIDVGTVLVVTLLVTFELLLFFVAFLLKGQPGALPTKEPQIPVALSFMRPVLFMLIFAEACSLSFLPVYIGDLAAFADKSSRELLISLPLSIFMLVWALSLPWAGAWSDRVGRRKPLLYGSLITALGLVLTAFSQTIFDLVLWRSLTALGYGVVYITCQGMITDHTTPQNRARGMAVFLAGFFSGSMCGAAIGGILADRVGYHSTFIVASGLALCTALFVYYFMQDELRPGTQKKQGLRLADIRLLAANRKFLSLTLLAAIPNKICLTGFLYFTLPLFLKFLGSSQSGAGRIIMTYGVAIVFISPFSAQLADRLKNRKLFVALGSCLSGVGLIAVYFYPQLWLVLLATTLLGLGHAISLSSQLALITEVCKAEGERLGLTTVMGIFRFLERAGNVTGPLLAGLFISLFSFPVAIALIGSLALVCALLFTITFRVPKPAPEL